MFVAFDKNDFLRRYRGKETFAEQKNEYYSAFLELLKDDDLLEKIRFANDILGAPPLETFILYHRTVQGKKLFCKKIEESYNKQGLGACFGYLYRFIYRGYVPVQCRFNDELTGIQTVSKFVKI